MRRARKRILVSHAAKWNKPAAVTFAPWDDFEVLVTDEAGAPVADAEVRVQRGDRLAQGIILPVPRITWNEVTTLRDTTRGGFGATGR